MRRSLWRLFPAVRAGPPPHSLNLDFTYLDPTDLAAFEAAIRPNTRMIWMESPSEPALEAGRSASHRRTGQAHGDSLTVIDNTFASPYCQRPLTLGFDLVLHSVTKYINGHSDMIGGIVVVGRQLGTGPRHMRFLQNAVGGVSGPFDSFLCLCAA